MIRSAPGKEYAEVSKRKWSSCQQLDETKKMMAEMDEEKRKVCKA